MPGSEIDESITRLGRILPPAIEHLEGGAGLPTSSPMMKRARARYRILLASA
jgi:hypothetical protein